VADIEQKVVHRALDGARVEIRSSLPESILSLGQDGTTSFVCYDVGSPLTGVTRREFSGGSAAFQTFHADALEVTLSERYTLGSGTLRAGSKVDLDSETGVASAFHLGVWEERVSAFIHHGRQADLVQLFRRFAFHDTPEGPWMQARPGADAVLVRDESHPPCIAKPIRTLGLLQVHPMHPRFETPPRASIRAESDAGTRVYVERGGTGDTRVLLVGPTAVSRLLPHEGVEEAKAVSEAATLELDWVAAA
jgi:hypothetical protein